MKTINKGLRNLALGAAIAFSLVSTSAADDIDVYVSPPPAAVAGDTLVVLTLDVRPNVMGSTVCTNDAAACDALFESAGLPVPSTISYFQLLVAALKNVIQDVASPKIKVALMVPHNDTVTGGKSCVGPVANPECSNGAYVLRGFTTTSDSTAMDTFFDHLRSIPLKQTASWSHPYQIKELFFEMYRYLTGGKVYNGENGLNDYGTDSTYNIDDDADTIGTVIPEPTAELSWDTGAQKTTESGVFYNNVLGSEPDCSSIFSVNFTFANSTHDEDSNAAMAEAPPSGFGFTPKNDKAGGAEQVLSYLSNTDLDTSLLGSQHITSYFITEKGGPTVPFANGWAQAGGTGQALLVGTDPTQLVDTLYSLFHQILGVSTTFVAASVPANVFNRAQTLNEVFLALFQPDINGKPFWVGNVKKLTTNTIDVTVYKNINGTVQPVTQQQKVLVDVNQVPAIDPLDGRIKPSALTYWTQTGTNDAYLPAPTTTQDALEYALGTDGRKVDRGGAGQVKPGYLDTNVPGDTNPSTTTNTTMSGPRKLFTDLPSTTGSVTLQDLDAQSSPSSLTTAEALLNDSRTYPGSTYSYGDHLFQTVMSCSTCTYASATSSDQKTAQTRVNNLIRYARGYAVGLDTSPSTTLTSTNKRTWWEADPLHSRPLALNYGARPGYSTTRPDIRVIVAGNDGMVQMIRDGRTSTGAQDGVESWAFLPGQFIPLQMRLLQESVGVYDPGYPVLAGDPPRVPLHPYAMDGSPTALIIDNNLDGTIDTSAGDKVYLYIGERRGGKRYYALDISDPDNPKLLWSIGKNDSSGDFTQLAETWSLMRGGIMAVDESGTIKHRPVLIFSGGYNGDDGDDGAGDLGKDSRVLNYAGPDGTLGTIGTTTYCDAGAGPYLCNNDGDDGTIGTDDQEGNALFIVNAVTGKLIWKVVGPPTADANATGNSYDSSTLTLKDPGMVDSVAASPSLLDSNGDGLVDRVYFADTGGDVWRLDAASPDRSKWTVTELFNGGRHFAADPADDRRFFDAPDIVRAKDDTGDFDAVILASGNRARPLGTTTQNWIYMIKDRATTSGSPSTTTLTPDDLADLTSNCLQNNPSNFSTCPAGTQTELVSGWKVALDNCESGGTGSDCGEKALSPPVTDGGTIFLTSYLPVLSNSTTSSSTCGPNEGSGVFYGLDLQTAAGTTDLNTGNDATTETLDRSRKLHSPGIPPAPVVIGPNEILPPDLQIQKINAPVSDKTFWYERSFK